MSQLDHVLDDALAGFDEDEGFRFASSTGLSSTAPEASPSVAAPSRPAAPSGASPPQSRAADSLSSSQCVPAPSAASSSRQPAGSSNSAKPFDPLKRRGKAKPAAFSQAAGLGGSSLGSSSSSSTAAKASSSSSSHSSSRPALTPEVHKLQEDLAKLMSEWSTAMHPEADEPSQPAAGQQQRGVSAVLAALAEQTQRTVQEQSRIRPPPAGAAAGGGAADAAGGGEQMTVIVDVVMQHLLSKEVLYQPMKVKLQTHMQESGIVCAYP
eukprot:GHUV01014755.1.p1 GENE.GHUV01014755.1~~GHUV01014755.1.p1  ORF type:complete len:267 (+),score=116.13 GHUV01014755.1:167-967(+)